MKKFLFFCVVLSFTQGFAQCLITGPDQIQVGEKQKYTSENAGVNCTGCFEWTYPDQKIFLENDTKSNEITIKGAVPGTAVLSLKILAAGEKLQCTKSIKVIAPTATIISPEAAKCDLPIESFKEIRLSDNMVAFEPEESPEKYSYKWTVTYKSGNTKVSTERMPKFQFSNQHAIDQVELQVTLDKCSKKIKKIYDTNFWYFF